MATHDDPHYRQPGLLTRQVMNPVIRGLTRLGVSVWGSRILEVRGRQSGAPRRTPVNLLEFEGRQYLVSPRGRGPVGPQRPRRQRPARPPPRPLAGRTGRPRAHRQRQVRRSCGPTCGAGRWRWECSSTG